LLIEIGHLSPNANSFRVGGKISHPHLLNGYGFHGPVVMLHDITISTSNDPYISIDIFDRIQNLSKLISPPTQIKRMPFGGCKLLNDC